MPRAAPHIDSRLLAALARLDDGKMPIAEVCRRLGRVADHLDLTRPSYEQVRVHVHAARRRALVPGAGRSCSTSRCVRVPPTAVYELLMKGERVPRSE